MLHCSWHRCEGDRPKEIEFLVKCGAALHVKLGDLHDGPEMKAGVAKFASCYNTIRDLDESGKTEEHIIKGAPGSLQAEGGTQALFFKHCWLLLCT